MACVSCDPSCVGCTAAGNTACTGGCQTGYYQQPAPATSSCLSTCPTSYYYYYADSSTNICEPCNSYCKVCTGSLSSTCSQCNPGYYFDGITSCVTSTGCPVGTYPDSPTSTCQGKSLNVFIRYLIKI